MPGNIQYPYKCTFSVNKVFDEKITVNLYSGLTVFVGPNGSGKTQTLKNLRDFLRNRFGGNRVRYLSSNRFGEMEQYRSRTNEVKHDPQEYSAGTRQTKTERRQIETVTGDFFAMDEKKDIYIKVAERLSVLFDRQLYLRWDEGNLRVFFEKKGTRTEYSVTAEASGLINVISILAALFDDDIRVLLVDEPEVSLHPQLQSYILREMKIAAEKYRKTIILSTHSSDMLSFDGIEDFSNIVFFEEGELPMQIAPDNEMLKSTKLREFLFRMGQTYKNGFFAKKVLLIEGASDLIICHAIANRLGLNIDVAGTQIIPVDGKGQFAVITKIFRLIHKKVYVLTDLDGFTDNNDVVDLFTALPEAAAAGGRGYFDDLIDGIRSSLNRLAEKHKDDMRRIYEKHPYWVNKKEDAEELAFVKRAFTGQLFIEKNIDDWQDKAAWEDLKKRLELLFSSLDELGCFILRKGAIESYYRFVSNNTYSEKPAAAIEEAANLRMQTDDFISENYGDIVSALRRVSKTSSVDESYAVRKELLSELPMAVEVLESAEDITETDLYSAIKQAKGNVKSLFNYHIINENGKRGIEAELASGIISVKGFPVKVFIGDNINEIVGDRIRNKAR